MTIVAISIDWYKTAMIRDLVPLLCVLFMISINSTGMHYVQGTRKTVSGGIRIPDNPILVRETMFKTMTETSWAECPAMVVSDFLKS